MRIINKKYLLIILLVGVILTGAVIMKPKEKIQLDNVILKQEVNNKTFAMYTETDNGYEEYLENSFPKGQRLNRSLSKCIDKNGEEIKDAINVENKTGNISVKSNKSLSCYLYFDNKIEDLSGNGHNGTNHAQLWTEEGITTSIDESNLGYIDCGLQSHDFQNTITMITRVKFNDLTGQQDFFGNWEHSGVGLLLKDKQLGLWLNIDNDYKTLYSDVIKLDTTIVGVYNGTKMSIYIDGQEVKSQEANGSITLSSMPIFLGANPQLNEEPINYSYTTFTDALVFDTALSDEEIKANFSGEINKEQIINM